MNSRDLGKRAMQASSLDGGGCEQNALQRPSVMALGASRCVWLVSDEPNLELRDGGRNTTSPSRRSDAIERTFKTTGGRQIRTAKLWTLRQFEARAIDPDPRHARGSSSA
jgi:hypothetical protein